MADSIEEKRKLLKQQMLKDHIASSSVEQDPIKVTPTISPLESGITGAFQGASLGLIDELSGGVEAAGRVAGLKGLGGSFSDISLDSPTLDSEELKRAYVEARDKKRAINKAAEDANFKSYFAGNIAGNIPTTVATGGTLTGLKGVGTAAALGGAAGLGTSDVDLMSSDLSAKDKILGTAGEVALGAGLGAGIAAIPAGLSALKNKTLPGKVLSQELAGNRIVGEEARRQVGDELVSSAGDIGMDVQSVLNRTAKEKNQILDQLSKDGQKIDISDILEQTPKEIEKLPVSFMKEQDSARAALMEPIERARELSKVPEIPLENASIEQLMETPGKLSARETDSLRAALGKLGYQKDLKDDDVIALAKRLSGKTAEKLNTQVDPVTGEIVKSPLGKANEKIQNLLKAQEIFNIGGLGKDEFGNQKALTPLLQRLESESTASDVARSQYKKGIEALKAADPELGSLAEQTGEKVATKYDLVRDINKPLTISREGAKRAAMIGSGYVGRGLRAVDEKLANVPSTVTKPLAAPTAEVFRRSGISGQTAAASDVQSSDENLIRKPFSQMSEPELMNIVNRLRSSPGLEGVASKIEKASESGDPREKVQAEFLIQQNPNARKLIEDPNREE